MITQTAINFILGFVTTLFALLPRATLADIPVIGDTISGILTSMVTTWNGFIDFFPYAGISWNIFLYVIIPFEITLLVVKFFLGHRTPAHINA